MHPATQQTQQHHPITLTQHYTHNQHHRTIYHEISRYEQQRGANKSTYWVVFELIWRDFFK